MSVPKLGIIILILGMFGCSSIQPAPPLCPDRYQPILISRDLQIPKEAIEIWAVNQRGFKRNIKDLEVFCETP